MTKKVLTVDDSKTMREMVSFTLSQAGFEVLTAEDGNDALKVMNDHPVDLVITDINMPNLDGIGLVKAIRANAAYRAIPILMLTTESNAAKKQEGKLAGATGWIVKPFEPEKLIQVAQKVCP